MASGWRLSLDRKISRFRSNIAVEFDGCWEWLGFITPNGYGRYRWFGKNWLAHRLFYKLFIDDNLNDDSCICHVCDNRKCVRPSHLFVGTQRDNVRDMVRKRRQRGAVRDRNKNTKIPTTKLEEIGQLYNNGLTQVEIGKLYGVCHSTIGKIIRSNESVKQASNTNNRG